ncbi:rhomboid family intramembrane serine protease [Putridiphycobacter roseus]|uniref:Rhomboid family intramembrane serine protease n=1 Tax=Putridiphycobacter roseus TaxID=2219161 RepID=A0A2W1NJ98_9FLAO|nr:rhomboid family intramembrane serine protease [Putridiphycobacter roseus]PZE18036.1 rhomboid family intramembrane serine protease [Putridiphycobacter roseus]
MFQNLFRNIPTVTKNLLIINVIFFIATFLFQSRGIDLKEMLGMHYPSSPYFEPYQIVTHFFMHANIMHIFFNMFALVIIGSQLERVWGEKRYLIFYLITALGAAFLYGAVQAFEIYNLTGELFPTIDIFNVEIVGNSIQYRIEPNLPGYDAVSRIYLGTSLGASGAIYGLLTAFAMLFPNTEFMLLFPPIPIKAKWMAIGLGAIALYSGFQNNPGDSVAHFAHLGGMLFGFILVKIWQKKTDSFY